MSTKLTNAHIHIFNGKCAPDYFFKVVLPAALDPFSDEIKAFIERKAVRKLIRLLSKKHGNSLFQKYLNFIEVGTQQSQGDIYRNVLENYKSLDPNMRFIALTLNMDHMDIQHSSHAKIGAQLEEIEKLRAFYPNNLFPFIGVDPRHKSDEELANWVRMKVNKRTFFGIKIYPALGFFPFDPKLDQLYKWAEENEIPVMTHCTRSGSYYTGKMIQVIPQNKPASLNPQSSVMDSIYQRIERFMGDKFTREDSKVGCNIFSNPENYIPILEKYPKLKLCLAHFGGGDELLKKPAKVVEKGLDNLPFWDERIKGMMQKYPNVYTDISYTLYDKAALEKIKPLLNEEIGKRILFGTDFFMTLQEDAEDLLWKNCLSHLTREKFETLAGQNVDNYLRSKYYDPSKVFV